MKKYFKQIHLWLALPAGLIIFIMCVTGAILVWNQEILSITGASSMRDDAFLSFVMKLHRWLLDDSRTIGKLITGISTLFFVFILISGLGIYWPKKWKRSNFTVHSNKGIRRMLFDLHAVLGVYAFVILLLCSLTGLMWSFKWYNQFIGFIFDAETQKGAPIWVVIKAIHFGSYLGIVSKIWTCVAALIGASLPITGYYLWIKKNFVKKKTAKSVKIHK